MSYEEAQTEFEDKKFDTSFRTFDGYDYTNIATIELKRYIQAMAVDQCDRHIAIIENSPTHNFNENIVRLYEVGSSREEDEDRTDDDLDAEDEETSDSLSTDSFRSFMEDSDFSGSNETFELQSSSSEESDNETDGEDEESIFYQLG